MQVNFNKKKREVKKRIEQELDQRHQARFSEYYIRDCNVAETDTRRRKQNLAQEYQEQRKTRMKEQKSENEVRRIKIYALI